MRAGVAPDHPNIKAVSRVYEKTAAHPEFRFYGHVEFGVDVTHADLAERYHAIMYAVGAQTDRRMGIPGEELPGSVPATEFVAWYNGHPDFCERDFDLSHERAVVIGNGNVAADVARMLALTRDELAETDVADHAIEQLADSGIREIVVLGRRGPAQAAFTNPELLELGEMTDADVFVTEEDAALDPLSAAYLESDEAHTTSKKNVDILHGYSAREAAGKRRRIVLRFLVSPVEIVGDGKVEAIRICRNELVAGEGGRISAQPTEQVEELECGVVFRSIGYKGTPLEGVPFDERRGTIPNDQGRVLGEDGQPLAGEYTVGWIKRGPSGIIGTNKRDAQETVDRLLEDLDAGRLSDRPSRSATRSSGCSTSASPTTSPTPAGRRSTRRRRRRGRPKADRASSTPPTSCCSRPRGPRTKPAANASANPRERGRPRRRARPGHARPRRRCR